MPTFRVKQYELHTSAYEIDAEDEADAIIKLLAGHAEADDLGLEFVEVCEDFGLPVDEYPELVEELRSRGEAVSGEVIPSICSVEEIAEPIND